MQDLIKHVTFNRLADVITAVEESNHMIIVSDGSGKDFKMTFGWIMSTPDGERVARCVEQSYRRESSLRAEATGMSSASVFIAMVRKYNSNEDKLWEQQNKDDHSPEAHIHLAKE